MLICFSILCGVSCLLYELNPPQGDLEEHVRFLLRHGYEISFPLKTPKSDVGEWTLRAHHLCDVLGNLGRPCERMIELAANLLHYYPIDGSERTMYADMPESQGMDCALEFFDQIEELEKLYADIQAANKKTSTKRKVIDIG